MKPYEDPANPNNSPTYHSGKPCATPNCRHPAGTAWSPSWCQSCNAKRMNEINQVAEPFQRQAAAAMRQAPAVLSADPGARRERELLCR